eukprot:TRINITY_DN6575_c0_g1_i1.p1 TRINITY_DN6575_c0_g1~~TRINITY_DN6575_c0_g1_i1.p1  ORF type:complete len:425 (-),score=53.40 TRINITY_DN6575_c0_g1_i1:118-1392(-)
MNFEEVLLFLKDYQWIFDFKVTEILMDKTLDKIPAQWKQYLNQISVHQFNQQIISEFADNKLPEDIETLFLPDIVNNFKARLKKILQNKSEFYHTKDEIACDKNDTRGLSQKKIHEVSAFSQFISEKCTENTIIDVGSGLGYLDERLLQRGFNVIGIESNNSIHKGAMERHKKMNIDEERLRHINLIFGCDSESFSVLNSCSDVGRGGCLVALHACGDLTNHIINAFLQSQNIRCMAVVSCCYHKMLGTFPLSQELKDLSMHHDIDFFNHYFLRLGANEPLSRWWRMSADEHVEHCNNVVFRAVLEIFCQQRTLELKKKRRKATKKSEVKDFDSYLQNVQNIYDLSFNQKDISEIKELYDTKYELHNLVENISGLQFLIQQVIESLILADRKSYLEQFGAKTELYHVFDDVISPRNTVIYAVKS